MSTSLLISGLYTDAFISVKEVFKLGLYPMPNSIALSTKNATSPLFIGLSKFI